MGQVHVDVSPTFNNIQGYLRSSSVFNSETKERLIDKKQMTGKMIEENIEGHKKSNILAKMKEYKEDSNILVKKDDRK